MTISAGTLQVGNAQRLNELYRKQGNVINGGVLQVAGPNSYSGGTTISGGTLQVGNANSLGSGVLTASSGVVLTDNGNAADFNGNWIRRNNLNNPTTTPTNAVTTFSGALGDNASLTKTGAGTLVLSGTNNYSGATTISAGSTLQIGNGERSSLPIRIWPSAGSFSATSCSSAARGTTI